MFVGYARVSTQEQNVDLQEDALKQAGCEKIFTDTVSCSARNREGLERSHEGVAADGKRLADARERGPLRGVDVGQDGHVPAVRSECDQTQWHG